MRVMFHLRFEQKQLSNIKDKLTHDVLEALPHAGNEGKNRSIRSLFSAC